MLDNLLDVASLRRVLGGRDPYPLPGELSRELAEVLAAASEQLLSAHLTFTERRAVLQSAIERFRRSPVAEQRALSAHLDLLDRLVPLLGKFGRRFRHLPAASRRKCLQACERSRWGLLAEGHGQLRHLVQMAFMECNAVWPDVAANSGDGQRTPQTHAA